MADRRIGRNLSLAVDTTGSTSFSALGDIKDITQLGSTSVETADVTILGDTYKNFRPVDIDPGEFTFSVQLDESDADYHTVITMLEDLDTIPNWQLTYADVGNGADTRAFTAIVTGLDQPAGKGEHLVIDITLKITGDPNYPTS